MQKYIALYLKLTGPLAAIALLFPGLVTLGFYLLIVPGLVLGNAPTAFLWGCIFAACWFAVKTRFGDTLATALIAAVLTALFLSSVTLPFRATGNALYSSSLLPDVTPGNRIAMTGDLRIELPAPRWDNVNKREAGKQRGFACDNLCVALLFTPGVKSVTINRSRGSLAADRRKSAPEFDPEARTYWLVPKVQCEDGGLRPDLESRAGLFPVILEEGKALVAKWKLRLDTDVCLRRSGPLGRHDILIRHRREGAATRQEKGWYLTPRVFETEDIEMRDATGGVLFRRLKINVYIPTRLLTIGFEGGPNSLRPGWGRDVLTNKPGFEAGDLLGELEKQTNTRGR